MKILVTGLGSMGKRRVRCLNALGYTSVAGFDLRQDRRDESEGKYGIKTYGDFQTALADFQPSVLVISVPPDVHHIYMKSAIENRLPFFVEASVVDTDMESIALAAAKDGLVAAPSATLLFHPAIMKIQSIIESGRLGKISNILYHSGQYLPDWHTYESVKDYYVSNPATGGAREIVPFELTWITKIFGFPGKVAGNVRKTIAIEGAERIDDTYNFLLDYTDFLMSITIDVVSRHATRRLLINGDNGQLIWDWNENYVNVYDPGPAKWEKLSYEMAGAESGYNQNIGENMYIEELRNFFEAVDKKGPFINSLDDDHKVLKLLYDIERSDKTSSIIRYGL